MPALFDLIELIEDLPDHKLAAGARGTIVECYTDKDYEVEFTNAEGETLAFFALRSDKFVIVWEAATKKWIPYADRIASIVAKLPEQAKQEIFEVVRRIYLQQQQGVEA